MPTYLGSKPVEDPFHATPEQDDVINCTESSLIVAGPGTGKTRTAIEKALRAIGEINPGSRQQVLFLSFSNAAVFRLAESAKLHIPRAARRSNLRFTTYHALASELLRHYGRFVGLPPRTSVVDKLEETLLALEEGWPESDVEYRVRLRDLARERGLLTFDVMVPLATRLLEASPELARILGRRFPLIVVDEFQDTSQEQWELLRAIGASSQVIAFGDPNQIIYSSLHAATEQRIDEFKTWKGIEASRFSAKNYRCGSADILEFAESLLDGRAFSSASGGVAWHEMRYRSELRAYLALFWRAVNEKIGPDQTIGILAPSNVISEDIAIGLRTPPQGAPVSFPVYARMARDDAAHDAVLLALAALRDYAGAPDDHKLRLTAVALLAMDLSWNSRKKRKLSKISKVTKQIQSELGKASALQSVVEKFSTAPRLEILIPEFIAAIQPLSEFQTSVKRMNAYERLSVERAANTHPDLPLFETLREAREPKGLLGYANDPGTTYVLNYHRAKGREFDYVAMIVDPRGESTRAPIEEARRLYYVCATRARRGLQVFYYRNDLGRVLGPVLLPAE